MAKIGIRVRGLKATISRMKRDHRNVDTAVRLGTQRATDLLRETAREMAPRDETALEEAIQSKFVKTPRGWRGEAYIDPSETTIQNGKSVSVYEYGLLQHEELSVRGTGGSLQLGPKSRIKNDHSAFDVGGKFFDRALAEQQAGILKAMDNTVRAATRADRKKDFKRLIAFSALTRKLLSNRI